MSPVALVFTGIAIWMLGLAALVVVIQVLDLVVRTVRRKAGRP